MPVSAKPGQRAFRPYGSAYKVLYCKDPVFGVAGPAGTGKSRTCLEKLHILAEKYPGCRLLIARKTRESLSEAALFTYEDKVLPDGHPVNAESIRRSHRQQYLYPNGSLIVVCGLDKPQKIMSTEYDVVYVQEATECEEADFEMLSTRLRNGVVPYQQLMFDCNPAEPEHWVYQRSLQGRWRLIESVHEDNPTLWEQAPPDVVATCDEWPLTSPDGRTGRYTKFGQTYLERLDGLTGARYMRLRLGKWAGAEGQIYGGFGHIHQWADGDGKAPWGDSHRPPSSWKRIWVVDFGFTAPMIVQKWAMDSDGRGWMYQEFYHSGVLVEDAAEEALGSSGWVAVKGSDGRVETLLPSEAFPDPLPQYVVMDWDAEDRATFEKHTGLKCKHAIKNISGGLQAVASRLKAPAPGVLPRVMFRLNASIRTDLDLRETMKPTCTIEEFGGYVWDPTAKKGERPLGKNDHGMDATRYFVADQDGVTDSEIKAADIPQAALAEGRLVVGVPTPRRSGHRRSGEYRRGRSQKNKERVAGARRTPTLLDWSDRPDGVGW